MLRRPFFLLLLVAGCSKGADADLQYIKQARSVGAEWALVNEQANKGSLTANYVRSMHRWIRADLRSSFSTLTNPQSRYGAEIQALLAEPDTAAPNALRAHVAALKRIENSLESA